MDTTKPPDTGLLTTHEILTLLPSSTISKEAIRTELLTRIGQIDSQLSDPVRRTQADYESWRHAAIKVKIGFTRRARELRGAGSGEMIQLLGAIAKTLEKIEDHLKEMKGEEYHD